MPNSLPLRCCSARSTYPQRRKPPSGAKARRRNRSICMLQSSRQEKCESFEYDDTLQRKAHKCLPLFVFRTRQSHSLSWDTKRGFLYPRIVADCCVAHGTRTSPILAKWNKTRAQGENQDAQTITSRASWWPPASTSALIPATAAAAKGFSVATNTFILFLVV